MNYLNKALKDNKGTGMQDAPFMVLVAVFVLVFAAALGIYVLKNFLDVQKQANAVDAAEKIYNTADLMSAGAQGSTRTIWVSLPDGYTIEFLDGNVKLNDSKGIIGSQLHIDGVQITGDTLPGRVKRYHLRLEQETSPVTGTKITVSDITE
jgi:hypothetical protein